MIKKQIFDDIDDEFQYDHYQYHLKDYHTSIYVCFFFFIHDADIHFQTHFITIKITISIAITRTVMIKYTWFNSILEQTRREMQNTGHEKSL